MARLAVDSGGRLTRGTNDLTLAAARAQRDLACRYVLGFYDRSPGEFRRREVRIAVNRPGLRALYAVEYAFRSPAEKRRTRLLAAWMAPAMFPGGVVRAHVFPLAPLTPKSWRAQVAVEFPAALAGKRSPSATYEFGATLRSGGKIVHAFNRRLQLESKDGGPLPDRRVSFLETAVIPPGRYEVTAVLSSAEGETIFTSRQVTDVPEIPRFEPFLVGPLLGRRASGDLVVRAAARREGKALVDDPAGDSMGSAASFRPILLQEVAKGEPLAAWTLACLVTNRSSPEPAGVERRLVSAEGEVVGTLPEVTLDFRSNDKVRCERLLDVVPVASLPAGGYRFEASLRPEPEETPGHTEIPFAVVPAN